MPDMPSKEFFREWLNDEPEFAAQYARARDEQADHYADEIVEIADKAMGKSAAEVNAARLAVEARKWVAAKLKPKKYGERIEHASDPDAPLLPPAIVVPLKELVGVRDPLAPKRKAG